MFKDNIASSVRSLTNAEPVALDRRGFLRLSVGTGAGLVIGAYVPVKSATTAHATDTADAVFNPFVTITPANK
ncbi:MAG: hypothetical protein WBY12_03360, partial [Hyphomicrobium sp.]